MQKKKTWPFQWVTSLATLSQWVPADWTCSPPIVKHPSTPSVQSVAFKHDGRARQHTNLVLAHIIVGPIRRKSGRPLS